MRLINEAIKSNKEIKNKQKKNNRDVLSWLNLPFLVDKRHVTWHIWKKWSVRDTSRVVLGHLKSVLLYQDSEVWIDLVRLKTSKLHSRIEDLPSFSTTFIAAGLGFNPNELLGSWGPIDQVLGSRSHSRRPQINRLDESNQTIHSFSQSSIRIDY